MRSFIIADHFWKHIILAVAYLFAFRLAAWSQSTSDSIRIYVDKLNKGQTEEVKQELPQLFAKYQNNPGVLYLQGRLASDGVEAMKSYQSIVDNFPKSEWADDALFRIYQYYYALGLYRTAELKRQQLKQEYPNSPFLKESLKQELPKQDEVAVNLNGRETVPPPPAMRETSTGNVKAPQLKVTDTADHYILQVGAFSSAANAAKQKTFFEDLGYTVEMTNKVRNGKSLYLVWVGSYKTPDDAKQAGRKIRVKYKIDSIVVERY